MRSDEWTARLHDRQILGYVGVYVDDLSIAGLRSLNDSIIRAVQEVWKTSAPEHLGPDTDCVPVLRLLGMNLERGDADKSEELGLLEVLMKFEPSLQLRRGLLQGIRSPLQVSKHIIFPLKRRSKSTFNHSRPLLMMTSLKLTRSRRLAPSSTITLIKYRSIFQLQWVVSIGLRFAPDQTLHLGDQSSSKSYHI